jgi:hypothetical protein
MLCVSSGSCGGDAGEGDLLMGSPCEGISCGPFRPRLIYGRLPPMKDVLGSGWDDFVFLLLMI